MKLPFAKQGLLLKKYLAPLKLKLFLLAVLIFGNIILQIINPQVLRFYLDSVEEVTNIQTLSMAALLFIGIAIVGEIIYVLSVYLSVDLAWLSTNALRFDLMRHCMKLDMSFHNKYKPGEMIERVDGDVNVLSNFFSMFSLMIVSNIFLLIGILAALFNESIIVGLAFTIITIIAIVGMYVVRNISIKDWKDARQKSSDLMGLIEEGLAGTEELKANDGVPWVRKRFFESSREEYDKYNSAVFKSRFTTVVAFFIIGMGTTMVYVIGIPLVDDKTISVGTLYLFTYYFELLLRPIFEIMRQIQNLQQSDASIDRVNELFATETKLKDLGVKNMDKNIAEIEFEDVSFAYDDIQYVLKNISFNIPHGGSLGLIGKTGSGKTTISRLLFRLYDYQKGRIKINHETITAYSLEELRRGIVIVTQNVELFDATVRENITFFDDSIEEKSILEVIELVGLKEWLDKQPKGLDTRIGKAGLSAGEAQLLAFARAFISDPSIVVLDEASSRLDPATEALIETAMVRLLHGRTAIIIAHRLETLDRVDDILILEEGRIKEYGNREKLMKEDSYYAHLLKVGMEEMLT
ncbi:MAG: ABC transporter ATP-binding protein [Candidatus Heimdallarchaeota archaeon]|nr:ABC transporter ATP-binding protein [Candidatus Heimdallarchaeota archaeon]